MNNSSITNETGIPKSHTSRAGISCNSMGIKLGKATDDLTAEVLGNLNGDGQESVLTLINEIRRRIKTGQSPRPNMEKAMPSLNPSMKPYPDEFLGIRLRGTSDYEKTCHAGNLDFYRETIREHAATLLDTLFDHLEEAEHEALFSTIVGIQERLDGEAPFSLRFEEMVNLQTLWGAFEFYRGKSRAASEAQEDALAS